MRPSNVQPILKLLARIVQYALNRTALVQVKELAKEVFRQVRQKIKALVEALAGVFGRLGMMALSACRIRVPLEYSTSIHQHQWRRGYGTVAQCLHFIRLSAC